MASEPRRKLAAGARLPADIEIRAHRALAILRAKKAALEAGVPASELDQQTWQTHVDRSDAQAGGHAANEELADRETIIRNAS